MQFKTDYLIRATTIEEEQIKQIMEEDQIDEKLAQTIDNQKQRQKLKNYNVIQIMEIQKQSECPICRFEFKKGQRIICYTCLHMIHSDCCKEKEVQYMHCLICQTTHTADSIDNKLF